MKSFCKQYKDLFVIAGFIVGVRIACRAVDAAFS